LDALVYGSEAPDFLTKNSCDLIDWLAFWR